MNLSLMTSSAAYCTPTDCQTDLNIIPNKTVNDVNPNMSIFVIINDKHKPIFSQPYKNERYLKVTKHQHLKAS